MRVEIKQMEVRGIPMTLMHFYAQMGQVKVGPYLVAMPDEMDHFDREEFTRLFMELEKDHQFETIFGGVLSDYDKTTKVREMAEHFMIDRCPEPTDSIVSSFKRSTFEHKDYYLPALKVLNYRNGQFWSPAKTVLWKNNQLKADHLEVDDLDRYTVTKTKKKHAVGLQCDCGIYGSVNIEELELYFHHTSQDVVLMMDPNFEVSERRLVIVEPSNNADVFIARKGWKASKVFISEVVGDTISTADASELLSMVWRRRIDVAQIFAEKVVYNT